ncbi:MAG: hypothetical protein HY288_14095 [Planctomycetia bacterium]|nr:hypothetical protein [Planctomycetia bacterium]
MLPIPFGLLSEDTILDAAKTVDTLCAYDPNGKLIERLTGNDRMARVGGIGAPAYKINEFNVAVNPQELAQLKAIVANALGV